MIMKNNRNSNKKKGAFLLRPVQVQNGRKNRLTAFLIDVCFVWLYLAGMTFWLESSLQLDLSMGICLLAALAAALLQQLAAGGWSENGAGRRWLGILSWCGALAVIALAAHQMWLSGIHQICNHAVDMLGHRTNTCHQLQNQHTDNLHTKQYPVSTAHQIPACQCQQKHHPEHCQIPCSRSVHGHSIGKIAMDARDIMER